MDISFTKVQEIVIHKDELPSMDCVTITIKYEDGRKQDIDLSGNENDVLRIVIE